MFDVATIVLSILLSISVLFIFLSIIVLPWVIYASVKDQEGKLLLISSFLFVGGAVFTLVVRFTASGQVFSDETVKYEEEFLGLCR